MGSVDFEVLDKTMGHIEQTYRTPTVISMDIADEIMPLVKEELEGKELPDFENLTDVPPVVVEAADTALGKYGLREIAQKTEIAQIKPEDHALYKQVQQYLQSRYTTTENVASKAASEILWLVEKETTKKKQLLSRVGSDEEVNTEEMIMLALGKYAIAQRLPQLNKEIVDRPVDVAEHSFQRAAGLSTDDDRLRFIRRWWNEDYYGREPVYILLKKQAKIDPIEHFDLTKKYGFVLSHQYCYLEDKKDQRLLQIYPTENADFSMLQNDSLVEMVIDDNSFDDKIMLEF